MKRLLLLAVLGAALSGCADPDSKIVNERANSQAAQAGQMGHTQGTPSPGATGK